MALLLNVTGGSFDSSPKKVKYHKINESINQKLSNFIK